MCLTFVDINTFGHYVGIIYPHTIIRMDFNIVKIIFELQYMYLVNEFRSIKEETKCDINITYLSLTVFNPNYMLHYLQYFLI